MTDRLSFRRARPAVAPQPDHSIVVGDGDFLTEPISPEIADAIEALENDSKHGLTCAEWSALLEDLCPAVFATPAPPPAPTAAVPGSPDKARELERRAAHGLALWHPGDAEAAPDVLSVVVAPGSNRQSPAVLGLTRKGD